jgi:lactoylglutathione lyase
MFQKLSTVILACLLPLVLSCNPPPPSTTPTNTYPQMHLGTDGPAEAATLGYTVNHFSLIVNDLAKTRHFYGKILGMRHIFTYDASANYSIMYMGHAQGGKNGTGYMTGEDLFKEKDNIQGLIEFVTLKVIQIPMFG